MALKTFIPFQKKIYSSYAYIQEKVVAMLKERRKPLRFRSVRTSNNKTQ